MGPDLKGVSWILTEPSATQFPATPTWEEFNQGLGRNRPENPCSVPHADSTYHSGSVPQGTLLYFMAETSTQSHATVRAIA